ncbi:MAG: type IX secretion system protein PorQ [Bacteroidia bacterium]
MKKSYILICFVIFIATKSFSQIGGSYVYDFLNLPSNARTAALGGTVLTVKDRDLSMAFQNPAVLNKEMNNQLSLSYIPYLSDIKYGYAAYAHTYDKIGTFSGGIQFVNYGKFDAADETGAITGSFNAADYSFNIAYAHQMDSLFSIGATLKTIYSHYEDYNSFGMAVDVAANYFNAEKQVCMTIIARNVGYQVTSYTPDNHEPLPIELQFGISKKLSKAPFRFGLNVTHLEKFDITFDNPNDATETDPLTGLPVEEKTTTANKILRHFIPSLELVISKNFMIQAAYNFQRRNELAYTTRKSTSGFSFGFGFGIKRFTFNYGRAIYNLAGGSSHFTVNVALGNADKK